MHLTCLFVSETRDVSSIRYCNFQERYPELHNK